MEERSCGVAHRRESSRPGASSWSMSRSCLAPVPRKLATHARSSQHRSLVSRRPARRGPPPVPATTSRASTRPDGSTPFPWCSQRRDAGGWRRGWRGRGEGSEREKRRVRQGLGTWAAKTDGPFGRIIEAVIALCVFFILL